MISSHTGAERAVSAHVDADSARDYVVILGEKPKTGAPSLTLSKALGSLGIGVRFARAERLTRREWIELVRPARAILLLTYDTLDPYLVSQLATAVALDVPIVRWWVGTDVLNAITRADVRAHAQRVDRIVSANIAVAPHLVEELATVNISARYIPSLLDPELIPPSMPTWDERMLPILIYLPDSRKDFYRIDLIEQTIASNPDLEFIVVADQSHALGLYPNVESLGWVEDMHGLYARAGCVLRITAHDGLPRMLMEALLRGLYAIYSWPLDGCWQARTPEEIADAIARYRRVRGPNTRGREAMLDLIGHHPEQAMSRALATASVPLPRRARALGLAVRTKIFPAQFA
jgi:hypothetical protein